METFSTLVIKVKYGDVLRRFNSQIVDGELKLTVDGLRKKIITLFNLDVDAQLVLTYIDEDGDLVTLADDDDIRDVVKQGLNPLRITAKLFAAKEGSQETRSAGNSTPLSSPPLETPMPNTNINDSGLLRNFQEPSREMLVGLASKLANVASAASSSAPGGAELVDHYIRLGLSYLERRESQNVNASPLMQNADNAFSELLRNVPESMRGVVAKYVSLITSLADGSSSSAPGGTELWDALKTLILLQLDQRSGSQPQAGVQSSTQTGGVPGSETAAETKNPELKDDPADTLKMPSNLKSELASRSDGSLDKLKTEAAMDNEDVNIHSATGGQAENPFFDFKAPLLGSRNTNTMQPSDSTSVNPAPAPVHPKSGGLGADNNKHKGKEVVGSPSNERSNMPVHLPHVLHSAGKTGGVGIVSCEFPSVANILARDEANRLKEPIGSGHNNVIVSDPRPTMNDCPFSGISMENVSAAPHIPVVQHPFRRSMSQNDGTQDVFHRGVRCDGCGIHPIIGPRFKSKVKVDYDLCSTCFAKIGNDSDYTRMNIPMAYRGHFPFKGFAGAHARNRRTNPPQVYRGCRVKPAAAKLDSCFVQDVNVIDFTVMAPSTPFTKIWRMRNSGAFEWPQGTQLVWIGGDKMSNALSVELEIPASLVWMNQELDIAVDFISPKQPGRYISYWRMATPSGQKFGQRVWVLIQVDASLEEPPLENIRNLNLNLPPATACSGPEIINVNAEPIGVYNHPESESSKRVHELLLPNNEQELRFPINDSLLVGNGASSSASDPISYPIIDLSDVASAFPSEAPPDIQAVKMPSLSAAPVESPLRVPMPSFSARPPVASPLPSEVNLEKDQIEDKLLRELEEMGFKQLDLNKEALRMNEYNLEDAVDHLCGVTEWDPMLEELQEMGFDDREMNKKLLMKNNGSIKRVVMDLIAGETD
ncbi:protein JOKA2-like [Andrographis paniculata]|uniref:protein JOKA2-like n=1 Tax=Andrographis paniculata TaxID=175694 RepID=UPI0021E84B11|nr:protein JOKA2-like [Andrographis paniculata]XP_051133499.1 protein JOKA2-like [Andrographis paniculata]